METFLNQPETTFYHITYGENFDQINQKGIQSDSGQIFVSKVGEFPVLLSIALTQLPEIENSQSILVWKLPQQKNEFSLEEIRPDQALEWTQPFHNIILRNHISPDNIEFMMNIPLGDREETRNFLKRHYDNIVFEVEPYYQNHYIMQRAIELNEGLNQE